MSHDLGGGAACAACSRALEADSAFCSTCGHRVGEAVREHHRLLSPRSLEVEDVSDCAPSSDPSECCGTVRTWARNHPKALWTLFAIILICSTLALIFELLPIVRWLDSAKEYMQTHHIASGACLFFIIFFGVSVFVPVALLEMFGIFVFGAGAGLPLVFSATVLGNVFCFFIARSCCIAHAHSVMRSFGRPALVFDRMIATHPWKITFLIRLAAVPMTIRNYLCSALTPITYTIFIVTTAVAHVPFAVIYVLIGTSAKTVAELTSLSNPKTIVALVIGVIFAVALLAATHYYYQRTLVEFEAECEQADRASKSLLDAAQSSPTAANVV